MASLRKRTGSPFWYLDWHDSPGDKGRRVVCTNVRHNDAKNPPKSGAAWDILRAKEDDLARRKFGLDASIRDTAMEPFLYAHLEWLKTTSGDISPETLKRYRSTVVVFVRWAKEDHLATFGQIDYAAASRFVLARSKERASKTVKMDCAFLAQVWDEAKRRNHTRFEDNPWNKLQPRSVKSEVRRCLTPEEIKYLMGKLPALKDYQRYVLLTALYTGARLTSIVRLARSEVHAKTNTIHFPQDIVKEAWYTVPLHPFLADYYRTYEGGDQTHFVPAPIRQEHEDKGRVQIQMQTIFARWRKAHTPGGLDPETHATKFRDISFHCLRHTFITRLQECGASKEDAKNLAGHSTAAITMAYTHLDAQLFAPAIAKLTY